MAAPVRALLNVCWYCARCNVPWSTIFYFLAIVLLNLFLDNARPGDASAAAKSTKGGNEGRKHLGGPVIHVFKVPIL